MLTLFTAVHCSESLLIVLSASCKVIIYCIFRNTFTMNKYSYKTTSNNLKYPCKQFCLNINFYCCWFSHKHLMYQRNKQHLKQNFKGLGKEKAARFILISSAISVMIFSWTWPLFRPLFGVSLLSIKHCVTESSATWIEVIYYPSTSNATGDPKVSKMCYSFQIRIK